MIIAIASIFCNQSFCVDTHQTSHFKTKIENYLNSIQTLDASFVQESNNKNSQITGRLLISKPSKLKLTYDKPLDTIMILNRGKITYYDFSVKEYAKFFNKNQVLELLTQDNFSLSSLYHYDIKEKNNELYLNAAVRHEQEGIMHFTITFSKQPIAMTGFEYDDIQGEKVLVNLISAKYNHQIENKEFEFKNPRLFNTKK